jgi:protein-tyrosine phosphatase
MSHATVVRYTTRPESAEENEKLIKAVFAQLADQQPDGLRYLALRLDDGASFVHIAVLDAGANPLTALPAFGEFVSAIDERCTSGPAPAHGTVVGAYGITG